MSDGYPFVKLAGTARQVGAAHGSQLGDLIGVNLDRYRALFARADLSWPDAMRLAEPIASLLSGYDPELMAELDGIAQGSGRELMEIIAINCRTDLLASAGRQALQGQSHGCTAAVTLPSRSADGHVLVAQNWDTDPDCRHSTVVMELDIAGKPPILLLTEAGVLMRSGLNSAGIGVTGNSLWSDRDYTQGIGVPVGAVRRRVLSHAAFPAAAAEVDEATRGHSNNHLVASADGQAIDLEAEPTAVLRVAPVDGVLVHANHFDGPCSAAGFADVGTAESSRHRQERVAAAIRTRDAGSVPGLQTALRDHCGYPDSVCSHSDPGSGRTSATVASLVMDLTERAMWVAVGPPCQHEFTKHNLAA